MRVKTRVFCIKTAIYTHSSFLDILKYPQNGGVSTQNPLFRGPRGYPPKSFVSIRGCFAGKSHFHAKKGQNWVLLAEKAVFGVCKDLLLHTNLRGRFGCVFCLSPFALGCKPQPCFWGLGQIWGGIW